LTQVPNLLTLCGMMMHGECHTPDGPLAMADVPHPTLS
jgi:hypothetical protein